jgi:hypothetical protein
MTVCNYIKFTLSHNSEHEIEGKPVTILIVSTINCNVPPARSVCVIMAYIFIHYTNDSEVESRTVLVRQKVPSACVIVV